jgi:hypothetical protein
MDMFDVSGKGKDQTILSLPGMCCAEAKRCDNAVLDATKPKNRRRSIEEVCGDPLMT